MGSTEMEGKGPSMYEDPGGWGWARGWGRDPGGSTEMSGKGPSMYEEDQNQNSPEGATEKVARWGSQHAGAKELAAGYTSGKLSTLASNPPNITFHTCHSQYM